MQTWMEGYESDIEYTAGYYREQEPHLLSLCAATQGIQPPDLTQPFTYCELGCGYGMTSLIMAANYPNGQFYAVDFNPTHIAQARSLATQAGLTNVTFLEKSFAQLIEDPSLIPQCDFIALHGIFTWVSDDNRQHIVDLCERHLKSGGMVYNSYNAKPGWSMAEPLQKLLYSTSKQFSGSSLERFDQSVKLLQELEQTGARFFKTTGEVTKKRLEGLTTKDRHYLVHEYLHEGWRAFYFTEVAQWMRQAKLEFIGGAAPTDALNRTQLSKKADELLAKIKDPDARELYIDVIRNTIFRRDIFMRGFIGKFNQTARLNWFTKTQWMLTKKPNFEEEFKFSPQLNPDLYRQILDRLSSGVCKLSDITGAQNRMEVVNALLQLYNANLIAPYYPHANAKQVQRFNLALLNQDQTVMALPHTRGSIRLKSFDARFYAAALQLKTTDIKSLSQAAYQELIDAKMSIKHQGQNLTGTAMLAHLTTLATKWTHDVMPILKQGGAL